MSVEVKKREGESLEGLLRRFTRRVQHSGILIRAKRGKHYERPKSERMLQDDAIRRRKLREKREYLRKIGKLEELMPRRRFGRKRRGAS